MREPLPECQKKRAGRAAPGWPEAPRQIIHGASSPVPEAATKREEPRRVGLGGAASLPSFPGSAGGPAPEEVSVSSQLLDSAPLDRSLRRAHRITLLGLAACALAAFLQPKAAAASPPPALHTLIAVGLAVGTILCRQVATSPRLLPKTRVLFTLGAFALATSLGVLGAALAMMRDAREAGLLFTLAAGLFCLRPPPPALPPQGRGGGAAC